MSRGGLVSTTDASQNVPLPSLAHVDKVGYETCVWIRWYKKHVHHHERNKNNNEDGDFGFFWNDNEQQEEENIEAKELFVPLNDVSSPGGETAD